MNGCILTRGGHFELGDIKDKTIKLSKIDSKYIVVDSPKITKLSNLVVFIYNLCVNLHTNINASSPNKRDMPLHTSPTFPMLYMLRIHGV